MPPSRCFQSGTAPRRHRGVIALHLFLFAALSLVTIKAHMQTPAKGEDDEKPEESVRARNRAGRPNQQFAGVSFTTIRIARSGAQS